MGLNLLLHLRRKYNSISKAHSDYKNTGLERGSWVHYFIDYSHKASAPHTVFIIKLSTTVAKLERLTVITEN